MNIVQGLLSAIAPLPDGDLADRLNYSYTSTILIVCSVFISGWSFVGQPIQCWFPAYYRGWWMEYALDYCYVQNTYFVGFHEYKPDQYFDIAKHVIEIPSNVTARDEKQIGYYQWVHFVLALQAFCFYLPVLLWRTIYNTIGFRVRAICETCSFRANIDPNDRTKNIETVARFLASDHELAATLGGRIRQKLEGKVILSTYLVRVLGNLHRHTLQCVLMINMFNEKIFIFLWFWFLFLAAVSAYSFFSWTIQSLSERADRSLIATYLAKIDPQTARSAAKRERIKGFVRHTLRSDGVFLLRLIAKNSGDIVACELLRTLWADYLASGPPPQYQPEPLLEKNKGQK